MTNAKKVWSWSTGERGTNRVRAYEDVARSVIFLEFYERPAVGGSLRRVRVSLKHADREHAKGKAEELAARIRANEPLRSEELNLGSLIDNYLREVTPSKSESKQLHDRRTGQLLLKFLGSDFQVKRLSRIEWDRFITDRRSGRLRHQNRQPREGRDAKQRRAKRPVRLVGPAQVARDLCLLRAMLNWATMAKDARGEPLLVRNPLKGLPLPKNESPVRRRMTAEEYDAILTVARSAGEADAELALILAHETGHRIGAIRQLRWNDVDLARGVITWRGEVDKIGFEHTVPITDTAKAALQAARAKRPAIGPTWVFPSAEDPKQPASRFLVRDWWERLHRAAGLPKGERLGWHSLRRQFATELKHTPLKDLAHLGGWKNPQTILLCYQEPDEQTQRDALAARVTIRKQADG